MVKTKRGSIFLITLTLLTVVFVIGFAFTFFTSEEDYSSSMSYESEVAFNLAESAVEEFVARIKNSLNNDDSSNQLYKVLRSGDVDISKEIPLDAAQVANLTAYTRDCARQLYGYQFDRGLLGANDFDVKAVLKLNYLAPTSAGLGEKVLYTLKQDKMEKQGELHVTATVTYKGHTAKVSLAFLIRCVKTFVPPFNYFTLYVKNASILGEDWEKSHLNPGKLGGGLKKSLRLDNGWKAIIPDFNPAKSDIADKWEEILAETVHKNILTPPGRIFLGQDVESINYQGPAVIIRSANGSKVLDTRVDANQYPTKNINGNENIFLRFDIPWSGMKSYAKIMETQGQEKTEDGSIWAKINPFSSGWSNDDKIRILNLGAGDGLTELVNGVPLGPSFARSFYSFDIFTKKMVDDTQDPGLKAINELQFTPLTNYGFHPWGKANLGGDANDQVSPAYFDEVSPTLIYGPAMRQYFRSTIVKPEGGTEVVLPFIAEQTFNETFRDTVKIDDKMTVDQIDTLLTQAGIPLGEFRKDLIDNWEKLPAGLTRYEVYSKFMSDSGMELYNSGLGNMLQKLRYSGEGDVEKLYKGKLADFFNGFLESYPYPYGSIPKNMSNVIAGCPVREYYEGPLSFALPDSNMSFFFDLYFIPRSTEDFFRGRTTVAIGGVTYDRFIFKYINDPRSYMSNAPNMLLKLNGILTLNDSSELKLTRLQYKGHGIIYSSAMMGGGPVRIEGDLLGQDTVEAGTGNFDSSIGKNLLTIIAPSIEINTGEGTGRCYVEANLISTCQPLKVIGKRPVTIKGTVVTPSLNIEKHFPESQEDNVIIYNPLNGIWRNLRTDLIESLYVAKIVTGGVGKFDWKYERL